jgi:hypothetical protein
MGWKHAEEQNYSNNAASDEKTWSYRKECFRRLARTALQPAPGRGKFLQRLLKYRVRLWAF